MSTRRARPAPGAGRAKGAPMLVYRSDDFAPSAGLPGVAVTELLDGRRGTASLTLGLIDLLPGGLIPAHRHPVEKVFYVLAGTATVVLDGQALYRLTAAPAGGGRCPGPGRS